MLQLLVGNLAGLKFKGDKSKAWYLFLNKNYLGHIFRKKKWSDKVGTFSHPVFWTKFTFCFIPVVVCMLIHFEEKVLEIDVMDEVYVTWRNIANHANVTKLGPPLYRVLCYSPVRWIHCRWRENYGLAKNDTQQNMYVRTLQGTRKLDLIALELGSWLARLFWGMYSILVSIHSPT